MKTFKYTLGGQTLTLTLSEQRGTVAEALVDGAAYVPTDEEMPAFAAAISLALIEHEVEDVHDDETGVITVERRPTEWNNPSEALRAFSL